MQANVPWGEFIICCQTKWIFFYLNWINSKHNFLLNPKWKWHLLKALIFRTRYNNQHAHPIVGYSCKTRKNVRQYIHENRLLDVSNNKKIKIKMCLSNCKFGSIWILFES
jgi:hypothetical protein